MEPDFTSIIFTYNYLADDLFRLITGSYVKRDKRRKSFYKLIDKNNIDVTERKIYNNWNKFWDKDDIYQEIYMNFLTTLKKYYLVGNNIKKRNILSDSLYSRAVLFFAAKLRTQLNIIERNKLDYISIKDTYYDPWDEVSVLEFLPHNLFKKTFFINLWCTSPYTDRELKHLIYKYTFEKDFIPTFYKEEIVKFLSKISSTN